MANLGLFGNNTVDNLGPNYQMPKDVMDPKAPSYQPPRRRPILGLLGGIADAAQRAGNALGQPFAPPAGQQRNLATMFPRLQNLFAREMSNSVGYGVGQSLGLVPHPLAGLEATATAAPATLRNSPTIRSRAIQRRLDKMRAVRVVPEKRPARIDR